MNKNEKKGGNATVAAPAAKVEKMAKAVVKKETAKVEGPEASVAEPAPLVPHINGAFEVGSRIETSLVSPLKVFGKKEATGTPAQMKPCAAIILEKLLPASDIYLSAEEALNLGICDYISDLKK